MRRSIFATGTLLTVALALPACLAEEVDGPPPPPGRFAEIDSTYQGSMCSLTDLRNPTRCQQRPCSFDNDPRCEPNFSNFAVGIEELGARQNLVSVGKTGSFSVSTKPSNGDQPPAAPHTIFAGDRGSTYRSSLVVVAPPGANEDIYGEIIEGYFPEVGLQVTMPTVTQDLWSDFLRANNLIELEGTANMVVYVTRNGGSLEGANVFVEGVFGQQIARYDRSSSLVWDGFETGPFGAVAFLGILADGGNATVGMRIVGPRGDNQRRLINLPVTAGATTYLFVDLPEPRP